MNSIGRQLLCLGAVGIAACSEPQTTGSHFETYMNEVTFALESFGWVATGTLWASAPFGTQTLVFNETFRYWSPVEGPDSAPTPGHDGSWFTKQYRSASATSPWELFPQVVEKQLEVVAVDLNGTAVAIARPDSAAWVLPKGTVSWVALPAGTIAAQMTVDAKGVVHFPTGAGWSRVDGGALVPTSPPVTLGFGVAWSLDGHSDYAETFEPGRPVLARVGPDQSQYYGQCYSGCSGNGNVAVSFILKEVKGPNPRTKAAQ